MPQKPEVELARQLMSGKPEAFDEFVDHFRKRIFHYTYVMCGQREDAEEVTQDALLKIFEHFHELRDPESVKSWVFRIARNACLMKRRKSVFAPERELSIEEFYPRAADGDHSLQIADWTALPDEQVLRHELRDALHRAISELPDIYKSAIILRDMEGLSTEEAAEVLEVSSDVVKTRLHRARLAIRHKLDEFLREAKEAGRHAGV